MNNKSIHSCPALYYSVNKNKALYVLFNAAVHICKIQEDSVSCLSRHIKIEVIAKVRQCDAV